MVIPASPLATREEAKAFSELELTSADPLTIVLSEKGWIRAAKGHDIDPAALSYKSGDGFRFAATGQIEFAHSGAGLYRPGLHAPTTNCLQLAGRGSP